MDARQHAIFQNEQRLRLTNEARALTDRAASAGRDMTAEENQQWGRIMDRVDEIGSERDRFLDRVRREDENAQLREMHPSVFGGDSSRSRFDTRGDDDFMRSWLAGDPSTPKTLAL